MTTLTQYTKRILLAATKTYIAAGRPLLPLTKLARQPIRWFFHRSRLIRHDSQPYLAPRILTKLHEMLIVDYPKDFRIYHGRIKFRSFGSLMSLHAYYVGEVEYHLIRFLISQLRPGFTMIDIGAHHGAFALIAAYELHTRGWPGIIHCYEPNPHNYEILAFNIHQNGLDDYIIIHQMGVSNQAGAESFAINEEENAGGTLAGNGDFIDHTKTVRYIQVLTEYLDDMLDCINHVDLIKIDVQGGEPQVLEGGVKMIRRDLPILIVEATQGFASTNLVRSFMQKVDYVISGVTADGTLCRQDDPRAFVSWDWICLPKRTGIFNV